MSRRRQQTASQDRNECWTSPGSQAAARWDRATRNRRDPTWQVACYSDRFQGLLRAPLRPESITARLEIRLKDRVHHNLRRHLHHSVPLGARA